MQENSDETEEGRRPSSALRAPSPRERGEGEDIAIIGGGIIGICAATYLAEAGRNVTIFDRTGICEETSSGNAAAFAFTDVLPLAHKGMIRQLPKWLADPLGPLSIPPAYLPKLLPWLVRFWRAGRGDRYETSLAAQAAMMRLAEAEWMGLLDRSGTRPMLREDGSLELYESEAEFHASLSGWAARERYGIGFSHVDGADLAALQPGLSPRFIKGTFVPGWKTVADPRLLGKAVWAHAERLGARFGHARVERIEAGADGATIVLADGTTRRANQLVIAAGAWSHLLARDVGEHIPLETERGYNTTLPVSAFDVKRQLIFSGHGFVITPLETGVRVGGAVELGGIERPPNFARSKAMLEKARRFLPGLDPSGGREWMGYRPSLPDSLPVIGRARAPNIFYAFGHGHLGLTQAAATGRLIRDLVLGQTPPVDLAPFGPQRF
ncbi:FAD-dependent oxidoreductase [Mesorhizobium sp. M4A.F.Ca.ET.020.02.1.1]|uniref:NAD(P)/FAD-dependent oxidoreductase n=7 Tax=Mesorhizobium TaxID=68287 RepID=UPI000F75A19B|nr:MULTISPECIES: FAD-dependent oxidoreductase [unclassified Mesorhizobium]AZO50489.1 FAD-dependent oxidoreductase [Mesorhizobium sp. M4B.F.Ca.ET.058.02.1.1]RVC43326.1 FAD-dependent oxidoreductase [Mesorhizobium sp. M4A.F.Ca.ET.090.04.2.1]RVC79183.1 FAD-dependent oxidoreductase [Mesorhizobium sp. M4A.F.Ca.ET.022.05.2.1]RVD31910.1 FAD-dependent oxidoreductase [Mesorhizobium sp. M4A.F.Ca.ET.020.02.1.1]RWC14001.1 MAG: FAD-dependent oxidoreductase [Mesorhizobium sp.]